MPKARSFPFRDRRRRIPRRIAKLVAAPLYYMFESGQLRSMLQARAVGRGGSPLPMFTYPAIDFLRSIEEQLRDCDVLEFGCGQSTLWFAPRVRSLVGVERNAAFRDSLEASFVGHETIRFISGEMPFSVDGEFDVIVIDGAPRVEAGKFAPGVLRADGIVILDNSDVRSLSAIPEYYHELGFGRVDFYGFSPTGVRKQCTSFFFRTDRFFRHRARIMPISKNSLTEPLR